MRLVDSHFHWYSRAVLEHLIAGGLGRSHFAPHWYELERLMAHMDATGYDVEVICSTGIASEYFSDVPAPVGREGAMLHNESMAKAQEAYPGKFWAAAAVPLRETDHALEVLEHAVHELDIRGGVSLPGRVGRDEAVDAPRLEPFYDRVEELGIPVFLHPTDASFQQVLDGYDGALHMSLGRVVDVSVSAFRLILSGIMERHPNLKVVVSHTGGTLPYQAGRLDKNAHIASLPEAPSTYLKRMYTDTVSPLVSGVRFAIEYFGSDHVLFGSDYPCWNPAAALEVIDALDLSSEDREGILAGNVTGLLGLADRAPARQGVETSCTA